MKKKVFLIVDWTNRIEQVFLKRFSAIGWLKNYHNCLPKAAGTAYWHRYKIIQGHIVFSKEVGG